MNISAEPAGYKLMVSGVVSASDNPNFFTPIWRGMAIVGNDGVEAGKLAAVVVNDAGNRAIDLLISRLPEMSGYWRVPVGWIAQVTGETIRLSATAAAIYALPQWHGA